MDYKIEGTTMPSLEIRLQQGDAVYTESGGMAWMTNGIKMDTNSRGGIGKMFGRALAGESLFLTTYTCEAPQALIVFTMESPGTILPVELGAGQSIIAQKDSFMVAEDDVTLEMHFRRKLSTGFFGGEGFILQKLTGPGTAFVEIAGEMRTYTLKEGQVMKVDPGHIAMYEPTVEYDLEMVKGLSNMFFGGEGLFLATLKGPGKVWLQTMPLVNLAGAIRRYIPTSG
ncbi:MAG: TIGR00266 family protein [Chloroflexota bacterium]